MSKRTPLPSSVAPRIVLLMGVSGCGKSTTGRNLSRHLGWEYRDADSFHPPANIEKMKAGTPLTDEDRWPWLDAIGAWIDQCQATGSCGIVSCSALRRPYRDRLRGGGRRDIDLVFLDGTFATIAERMQRRKDHFMPPALLRSQFDALERPTADENALLVPISMAPRKVIERIVTALRLSKS
jgi:gluconokinase